MKKKLIVYYSSKYPAGLEVTCYEWAQGDAIREEPAQYDGEY